MKTIAVTLCAALAGAGAVVLTAQTAERVDSDMVAKIRDEGLKRSRVQAVFNQFVDVIGPRLTASPEHKRAAEWARDELTRWGLSNARLEPFEFGRGWALDKFTLEMVEPRYMPLVGYPEAWSPPTRGEIVASVVGLAGAQPEAVKGMEASLKGAAIMTQPLVTNFIRADRAQPRPLEPAERAVEARQGSLGPPAAVRAAAAGGRGRRGSQLRSSRSTPRFGRPAPVCSCARAAANTARSSSRPAATIRTTSCRRSSSSASTTT
jgi:hypothetical protein